MALACCVPAGVNSKALLAENWVIKAAEAAEAAAGGSPPPAFLPADPQYNELARRLSKSAPMTKLQALQQAVVKQEKQLQCLTGEAKEAKKAELEETQQQLSEAQAALSELQASFEQDPLSLAPWMNGLFALADAGCSTFDTGGDVAHPHSNPPPGVPLLDLMAPAPAAAAAGGPAGVSAWLYRGAERVLGAFKRRYDLERGPGHVRITARLALSPFGGASTAELCAAAEAGVEATRQAVLGPEGAAAGGLLDTLLLHWMDYEDLSSFVAVLLSLKRLLAPPGYDPAAAEAGALEVTPKLAALGLVNPTPAALTAAVRAGVPISCVSLPFSLLDTSAAPLVAACAQQGIQVYATAPTAHGLISEAYLGVPPPHASQAEGAGDLAAGLEAVARYGGWSRFQGLLAALKGVADKHDTSLQVVALAWLQQQGVVPLLPAHWGTPGVSQGTGPSCPWPLSLGLQHYTLDPPPPAVRVAAVAALAAAVEEAVAAVAAVPAPEGGAAAADAGETAGAAAAAEAGEGEAGAAATEAAGGEAKAGGQAPAEGAQGDNKTAGVTDAAPAAAAGASSGKEAGGGGSENNTKGCWVGQLSQLLSQEDLAALAAFAGRPVAAC